MFAAINWLIAGIDWIVDEMIVEEKLIDTIVKTGKWWEGDGGSIVWYVLQMWEHDE